MILLGLTLIVDTQREKKNKQEKKEALHLASGSSQVLLETSIQLSVQPLGSLRRLKRKQMAGHLFPVAAPEVKFQPINLICK